MIRCLARAVSRSVLLIYLLALRLLSFIWKLAFVQLWHEIWMSDGIVSYRSWTISCSDTGQSAGYIMKKDHRPKYWGNIGSWVLRSQTVSKNVFQYSSGCCHSLCGDDIDPHTCRSYTCSPTKIHRSKNEADELLRQRAPSDCNANRSVGCFAFFTITNILMLALPIEEGRRGEDGTAGICGTFSLDRARSIWTFFMEFLFDFLKSFGQEEEKGFFFLFFPTGWPSCIIHRQLRHSLLSSYLFFICLFWYFVVLLLELSGISFVRNCVEVFLVEFDPSLDWPSGH